MTYVQNFISKNTTINVPADFDSVSDALDSIRNKFIKDDVVVTISIAAGVYTISSEEVWSHPQAENIKIVGASPIDKSLTYSSYSGAAYAYYINFSTDVSNITTDDYVLIYPSGVSGGASGYYQALGGCLRITSVGGSAITCFTTVNNRWGGSASCTFSAKVLKTVLHFTSINGVRLESSFRSIENIAFVGDGSLSGAGSGGVGNAGIYTHSVMQDINYVLKQCGFYGWRFAIQSNNTCKLYRVCATNCYGTLNISGRYSSACDCAISGGTIGGYQFRDRNLRLFSVWVSGCVSHGIYCDTLSNIYASGCVIALNGGYGITSNAGDIVLDGCSIINNASFGVVLAVSNVLFNGNTVITLNNGSSADILASSSTAHVSRGTATITGTYTTSPIVRTLGNYNSYIY